MLQGYIITRETQNTEFHMTCTANIAVVIFYPHKITARNFTDTPLFDKPSDYGINDTDTRVSEDSHILKEIRNKNVFNHNKKGR